MHAPVSSTRPRVVRSLIERERIYISIFSCKRKSLQEWVVGRVLLPLSLSLSLLLLAQLPMGGIIQQTEKTKTKNKIQTPKFFKKHSGYLKHWTIEPNKSKKLKAIQNNEANKSSASHYHLIIIISLLLIRKWFRDFVYAYVIIIIISLLVSSFMRSRDDWLTEWMNEWMKWIELNWIDWLIAPPFPPQFTRSFVLNGICKAYKLNSSFLRYSSQQPHGQGGRWLEWMQGMR